MTTEDAAREMEIALEVPVTEAQLAELRKRWEAVIDPPLQVRPMLHKETILAAIRECVTVVKPGETLAVRLSENFTSGQLREYQEAIDSMTEYRGLGIHVLVLPGEELAVLPSEAFTERVWDAMQSASLRHS